MEILPTRRYLSFSFASRLSSSTLVRRYFASCFRTDQKSKVNVCIKSNLFYYTCIPADPLERCMDDRLTPFYLQNSEFNANIRHLPRMPEENNFIPYVGNGYFGMEIQSDASINIKGRRSLKVSIFFHPVVSLAQTNGEYRQATVVEYLNGIVHRWVLVVFHISD